MKAIAYRNRFGISSSILRAVSVCLKYCACLQFFHGKTLTLARIFTRYFPDLTCLMCLDELFCLEPSRSCCTLKFKAFINPLSLPSRKMLILPAGDASSAKLRTSSWKKTRGICYVFVCTLTVVWPLSQQIEQSQISYIGTSQILYIAYSYIGILFLAQWQQDSQVPKNCPALVQALMQASPQIPRVSKLPYSCDN